MDTKQQQSGINQKSVDNWDYFASHRAKVTEIVSAAAEELTLGGNLPTCGFLGAGNGNDLDLTVLAQRFSSIHLFDIDENALGRIKTRYQDQSEVLSRLVFEDPVDVSSVFQQLNHCRNQTGDCNPRKLYESANKVSLEGTSLHERKFDVVVSACLLSQLILAVVETFDDNDKTQTPILLAVRDGHLRLLVRLTKAPGRTILITDFVSSDTLPQLAQADDDQKLLAAARTAIDDRNFFTGTNPWAITAKLSSQLQPSDRDSLKVSPPWRWQFDKRFYAVAAITFSVS